MLVSTTHHVIYMIGIQCTLGSRRILRLVDFTEELDDEVIHDRLVWNLGYHPIHSGLAFLSQTLVALE